MTDDRDGQPRIPGMVVLAFYLVLGGIAWFIAAVFLDRNVLLPYPERVVSPWIDLGVGAGMGLAVVFLSGLLDRWFEWSRSMTRTFRQVLGALRPRDALLLAAASSIGEELLFRGLLLPTLGIVASSLLFGVLHGLSIDRPAEMAKTFRQFFPLVVIATLLGFAFGGVVAYTGSILVAVVAHFTVNFLNLGQMYRAQWQTGSQGERDG